ncbi:hypothetical protein J6590_069674 [Homalodisca vitripennis]|nr:hypothetical protein J6590_069674 [Homalodisca vitripennis]
MKTDTCSTCDKYTAETRALDLKLGSNETDQGVREKLLKEKRALDVSHEVHLRKQETVYVRKKKAKDTAMQYETKEAINNFLGQLPLKPPVQKKGKAKLQFPLTKKQAEIFDLEEKRKRMARLMNNLTNGEFPLPEISYEGLLPISEEKFNDIKALKQFCGPEAKAYFDSLPHKT